MLSTKQQLDMFGKDAKCSYRATKLLVEALGLETLRHLVKRTEEQIEVESRPFPGRPHHGPSDKDRRLCVLGGIKLALNEMAEDHNEEKVKS